MKYKLFVFVFCLATSASYAQYDKGTTQAGICGLPVIDVFKFLPNNDIKGIAGMANLNAFVLKNLSVGLNPYAGRITNSYSSYSNSLGRFEKTETLNLIGLNASFRYYFTFSKIAVYPLFSVGFGNLGIASYNAQNNITISSQNISVMTMMAGAGVNYFLTKKIALECNIPFTTMNSFPDGEHQPLTFKTITPTLGVQFYFYKS